MSIVSYFSRLQNLPEGLSLSREALKIPFPDSVQTVRKAAARLKSTQSGGSVCRVSWTKRHSFVLTLLIGRGYLRDGLHLLLLGVGPSAVQHLEEV